MKQTLGSLALLALIFGGILSVIGWQEWSLFRQGSPTPQTITLADLEKNGPGNNVHVTVTNVDYGLRFVYEAKGSNATTWQSVWIPLYPPHVDIRDQNYPVKVVLHSSKIKDQQALEEYCQRNKSVTGVITNAVRSLDNKQRENLQKDYPKADFANVWILDEARSFPSATIVFLWLGIGVGLIVLGVAFAIGWLLLRA